MRSVRTRENLVLHGKHLEYFTIAWNSLEGLVAVVAGAIAGSISLMGFGIDSFIEVTSGGVLLWGMFLRDAASMGSTLCGTFQTAIRRSLMYRKNRNPFMDRRSRKIYTSGVLR